MHLASRLPALDHIIQTVLHPVDKKKKKKGRATSRFCRVQSVPETTRIFSLSPVLWTTFIRLRKEEWKQTQKTKKNRNVSNDFDFCASCIEHTFSSVSPQKQARDNCPLFSFSFFFLLFFPMLSRKFCQCLRFSTPRLVEINHVTSLWWNITRRHTHGHKHHGRGISGFRLGEIPDQGGFKVQVAATSRLLSANERFVHTQETTGLE